MFSFNKYLSWTVCATFSTFSSASTASYMADTSSSDSRLTVIVTLKIKPEKVPRMIELWHEQNAYIDSNELPSDVKFSTFRNHDVENEFIVIQE